MKFKAWLETLQLQQTIPPSEISKRIWVTDPNNPQQITHWQKHNTRRVFTFPLANERFVHFTLPDAAQSILDRNAIGTDDRSVFAVSLSFGKWLPVVQYQHIRQRHPNRPNNLYSSKDIVAIIFQTDKMPNAAFAEEVTWNPPVPIKNVQVVPSRDAIRMLKKTPYNHMLNDDEDSVKYV